MPMQRQQHGCMAAWSTARAQPLSRTRRGVQPTHAKGGQAGAHTCELWGLVGAAFDACNTSASCAATTLSRRAAARWSRLVSWSRLASRAWHSCGRQEEVHTTSY